MYQTVTSTDGLILYAHSPFNGLMNDSVLYIWKNMNNQLEELLYVVGFQYFVHGDS